MLFRSGSIEAGLERKGFSQAERDMILGDNYFAYLGCVLSSGATTR